MNQETIDRFVFASALAKALKPELEKHNPDNIRGRFEAEFAEYKGKDARLPITAPDGTKVGDFFPEHATTKKISYDVLDFDVADEETADWVKENVFELFTDQQIINAIHENYYATGEVPPNCEVRDVERNEVKVVPSRAVIKLDKVLDAYALPEPVRGFLEAR